MERTFKRCSDSAIMFSQLMLPSYSNFGGKIHGGYILSLMDQIAFACASKHSETYCVTASVEQVDFINPIEVGELVTLKASINFVGNTSMVVGIRVESENIKKGVCKHCNSSYFSMVAKDDDNKSVQVPGLILESPESIRRFITTLLKIESKKANHPAFDKTTFKLDDYRDLLKQHPVQLTI